MKLTAEDKERLLNISLVLVLVAFTLIAMSSRGA